MKQAEEAKRNAIESARRAFEDYQPLKHEVDLMRTELLGLEKLPDLPEDEKEKLGGIGCVWDKNTNQLGIAWLQLMPVKHFEGTGK